MIPDWLPMLFLLIAGFAMNRRIDLLARRVRELERDYDLDPLQEERE